MLLKTALKNLKKNPIMNIMCLIQLTAVFLITAVMVSAICIRYRTYDPVKDILERDGLYCVYSDTCGAVKPGGVTLDIRDSIFSGEELNRYMKANDIITIQTATAILNDLSTVARPLFYDSELIKRYSPALKKGRWVSPDSNELEMVIPAGTFGADINDTVELLIVQVGDPKTVTAKIVGILEDGAEILGNERSREISGDTYRLMYEPYYSEIEEGHNPILLFSADALNRLYPDVNVFIDSAIFIYNAPTDEDMDRARRCAAQLGSNMTISLNDMNINSKSYLREQLLQLLPIVVVLMILVVVNSISVSAIVTRQRLKDYTKYYILGLQWRQCALVNLLQALTIGAASLIIAIILILAVNITKIAETVIIIWNFRLLLSFFGILALYLIFSMIMPLIMLGSTTPKEQLQAE